MSTSRRGPNLRRLHSTYGRIRSTLGTSVPTLATSFSREKIDRACTRTGPLLGSVVPAGPTSTICTRAALARQKVPNISDVCDLGGFVGGLTRRLALIVRARRPGHGLI